MFNKKAQSLLDFLITWGWAILVIIAGTVAFFYFYFYK